MIRSFIFGVLVYQKSRGTALQTGLKLSCGRFVAKWISILWIGILKD
jgi:hypothetical protein